MAYPISKPANDFLTVEESSSHIVMAVKCEQQLSSLSLEHIREVESLIRNTFNLTKHACVLLAVDNDKSVIIYWSITKSIEALITNRIQGFSSHFYENGLLEVTIHPNFSFVTGKGASKSPQDDKILAEVCR